MRELPLLMSGPLVGPTLRGEKTETRRLVKSQSFSVDGGGMPYVGGFNEAEGYGTRRDIRCPYGAPGDRLWVRETWHVGGLCWSLPILASKGAAPDAFVYAATPPKGWSGGWRPSIHMPRWASRLSLDVLSVRVERLQDITEEGAKAEGVEAAETARWAHRPGPPERAPGPGVVRLERLGAREAFAALWDSLAPEGSRWSDNPWVWVVAFRRVTA